MGRRPDDPLAALLARYFATGDAAAMEDVVRRTRARLLRIAGRIGRAEDAEDAVQGAYHALLRRGALPDGVPPMGWLVTTVVRIAWRLRARERRFDDLVRRLDRPAEPPGPDRGAERAEAASRLRAAIARLPAKYRDPLVLHHLEGVPVAELAGLMELNAGTVKTRLRRGRRLLEGRLAPLRSRALVLVWSAIDALRPAGTLVPSATGGIMKLKTATFIGLVAVVSGVTGFALGEGTGREPHPAPPVVDPGPIRIADDGGAEASAAADPAPPAGEEPATTASPPPRSPRWMERLAAAAESLGVSEPALARAKFALAAANGLALQNRSGNAWQDQQLAELMAAVDDLKAMGEEGYRALLALAYTGYSKPLGGLIARLVPPGGERRLIHDAADPARPVLVRLGCLDALAHIEGPEVDAALRDLVARTDDPAIFVSALRAAAPRGGAIDLARVEAALANPDWEIRRVAILGALGKADGAPVTDLLLRVAKDPDFGEPGPALAALAEIDADRARSEAAALLDGPRGADLPPAQRARLRVVAGRW